MAQSDLESDADFEVISPSSTAVPAVPSVGKKRQRTSDVWIYMDENTDRNEAKCKNCSRVYTLGDRSHHGTGNLRRHVRKCYKLDDNLEPIKPSDSVLSYFVPITPVQKKKVFQRILEWIIADQQAFEVVKHPAFQAIFAELPGAYQLSSSTKFRAEAEERFVLEKQRIKDLLSTAPGNIALTCDGWSSSGHDHYLGITAHWIDANWNLQRIILDFPEFPLPRSAPAGKQLVAQTMSDFGIAAQVHAMVTDNTPSAYNISELMALDQNEWFFEHRCGAHVINLVIKHSLEDEGGCADLVPMRTFVAALHRTDRLRTIVKAECNRLNVTYHLPPLACDTRWGSTLNLLEGILKIETVLLVLFRTHSDFLDYAWGDSIWTRIRDLVSLLHPLNGLSKLLQGQDFPTIGLLSLGYDFIARRLETIANDAHSSAWLKERARTFGRNAMKYTSEWLSNGRATPWAVFMDPSIKDALIVRDANPATATKLKDELIAHVDAYYPLSTTSTDVPDNEFLAQLQEFVGTSSTMTTRQEVDCYFSESRIPAGTVSALSYWQSAGSRFPRLSQFARDVLCIPATTAPSEAAFSRSGQLITARRNRLNVDSVKILMCLDSWLGLERRMGTRSAGSR